MKIILLGAPGSGKGTYSAYLQQKLNIPHISTGDLFRLALSEGSQLGLLAHSFWGKGNLVPDDVTIALVKERLSKTDCKNGFILDGFPRTISQAESLATVTNIDLALYFNVDLDLALKRLLNRVVCTNCGAIYNLMHYDKDYCQICNHKLSARVDDEKHTIEKRFEVYKNITYPVILYYKEKPEFREINANTSAEVVHEKINEIVGEFHV